jgi:Tfp pilus assembly protein PilO
MTDMRRIVRDKRAVVWPIAAGLVLNILLFAIVVYPLSQKVAGGQASADAAAQELRLARQDHASARATVTGKGQADTELQKFYRDVLPPDLPGARRIMYLRVDQLARQSNLRPLGSDFDQTQERDSTLQKVTMTVRLAGEYTNIRRFIHQLETTPDFLVLERVDLVQGEEQRGVNLTAQISTYYRTGGDGN